eukprot:SAG22_NODE_998_length_6115_cov_2.049701_1_plen_187_part_00
MDRRLHHLARALSDGGTTTTTAASEQPAPANNDGADDEEERRLREAAAARDEGPGARAGKAELAYNNWSGESRGITAPALLTPDRTELLRAVSPGPAGLSDDDVRGFCARGFVVVRPAAGPEFHASNIREFDRNDGHRNYGSNKGHFGLKPKADGSDWMRGVYEDPAVVSALRSIMGPCNVMHWHK